LAYEHRELPEFSWSPSRQRLLDDWPRAYFYRYYLSWNGWLDDPPADAREAYRLGKLTGFDALFGLEIDKRALELEQCARQGLAPPTLEEMERRTREALNDAWRSSKRQRQQFDVRPKQVTMLRALYLGQDAAGEVERVEQRLRLALDNLASREHWLRIAECGADGKVELPEFASFSVDGIKVFALPDLAYVHRGTLHVIDWKSGRRSEGHQTQVLLSSFWALSTPAGREATAAAGHLEYLAEGAEVIVDIPADLAESISTIVRAGVQEMRALLRDPGSNAPLDRESFVPRESGLCRTCNFLPLCKRHRQAER
jgi:hypothetical protein